jgi:tRNA modification GTPase
MNEIVDRLLGALARIEAYIDFPEEDLPPEDRQSVTGWLEEARALSSKLLATNHYGDILREGIKTVIVGETNAGKSSLLNRLVGHERAIVSPEPGTTRDYIEERIAVGAHSVRLIDTAGLNSQPGELERLGIQRTLSRCAEADLILLVGDATRPPPSLPPDLKSSLRPESTIEVVNKIDLLANPYRSALRSQLSDRLPVLVSALTGEGMETLETAIGECAERFRVQVGDEMIAVNARHAKALEDGSKALVAALELLGNAQPLELVASEARQAMSAFEEIAGRIDNERVLDRLFATFCIGK